MKLFSSCFAPLLAIVFFMGCEDKPKPTNGGGGGFTGTFYFGADLSYVNQILDHGGVYRVADVPTDPYKIFADGGTDIVRLRIWHNPVWTKEIYEPDGPQLYNDLLDVGEAISKAKDNGMKVMLDFHYSDEWADPGKQKIPAAWTNITLIEDLRDSVYNYTFKTLKYLSDRGLMPDYVQIGNETNCGMFFTEAPENFPSCNVCDGAWSNLQTVINAGIKAVRDVSAASEIDTEVILHVADPKNVEWWFDNITAGSGVTDFDIIGFSYYPIWHTTIPVAELSTHVANFKEAYGKEVMILETAYPWTLSGADSYNNIFGSQDPISGYPFTRKGQVDMMTAITQEMIDGGGIGMIYWEPAWISSSMKDMWGTGSSWENCTFFDYEGKVTNAMGYMMHPYK